MRSSSVVWEDRDTDMGSPLTELSDETSSISPDAPAISPGQRMLSVDEVYDRIFSCCSPGTLIRLSWTCRAAYAALHSYYRRGFNINRHLARYFPDPRAFRCLQARTGTLVSGSNALQFFDRTHYPNSDLDLYVSMTDAVVVADWLVAAGYVYQARHDQAQALRVALFRMVENYESMESLEDAFVWMNYGLPGVAGVFTFVKPVDTTRSTTSPMETDDDDDIAVGEMTEVDSSGSESEDGTEEPPSLLKVQIIAAITMPLACILEFHSSCVFNFITHEKAYSLYPKATFEDRRTLLFKPANRLKPATQRAIEKYRQRGWKILYNAPPHWYDIGGPKPGPDDPKDSALECTSRWADDGLTWVIPLTKDGVSARIDDATCRCDPHAAYNLRWVHDDPHPDPAPVTNWHLRTRWKRNQRHEQPCYAVVSSPALRDSYVIADRELQDIVKTRFHPLRAYMLGTEDGIFSPDVPRNLRLRPPYGYKPL
ncbi:hypothetical protein EWM64_g3656 [Hericium alpestre]|uniref:F-box domain-containing protein n=1 Tax=Hericium alpestre TaxID=135208 RepID=A0A4Z0A1Z6_9AGAM|nr:hypothetical protein EWM64_g3656 [Hericium alpestre]